MTDGERAAIAAALIVEAVGRWARSENTRLVVAIDGNGAAGKSTLGEAVAAQLGAALIHVDDFWRGASALAGGPPREEPMAPYYDWARLRDQALAPLLAGRGVRFLAVDPDTEATAERAIEPAPVIIVEGVSASCEALIDLVDRTILVDTPEAERLARLRSRVPEGAWDDGWLEAERHYLATRPPEFFDLVVSGSTTG